MDDTKMKLEETIEEMLESNVFLDPGSEDAKAASETVKNLAEARATIMKAETEIAEVEETADNNKKSRWLKFLTDIGMIVVPVAAYTLMGKACLHFEETGVVSGTFSKSHLLKGPKMR